MGFFEVNCVPRASRPYESCAHINAQNIQTVGAGALIVGGDGNVEDEALNEISHHVPVQWRRK